MSQLTERYSGSAETTFDEDIKSIARLGIEDYFKAVEDAELSEAFWRVGLVGSLETSTTASPFANIFFAAQARAKDKGFLSSDITVADMITISGDIHHLFPKEYLKPRYGSRREYNQLANLVYAQTEINIRTGKKSPKEYFDGVLEQCKGGRVRYGGITDEKELYKNLEAHCIPREIVGMTLDDYPHFLAERRRLMAGKIKEYYEGL
jgi:hypothetical protein